MEMPTVLLILSACLVLALLIAAARFVLSHLADLREIGENTNTGPGTVVRKPEPASRKSDAASALLAARNIIVIPGYGMGVSRAQFRLWELAEALGDKGIKVSFAVHPSAGRMPGHMNILLDEAEVPHASVFDLEHINHRFPECDLVLIVGANDVVNPLARSNVDSPLYGMPILDADKAMSVFVIKRGQGSGYSGIDNPLFTENRTSMLYGDAQDILQNLVNEMK